MHMRDEYFGYEFVALAPDARIFFRCMFIITNNQINEERSAFFIKWKRVLIVPFCKDISRFNSRHDLHGMVPCDHRSFCIDSKRSIRKELNNI